MTGPEAVRSLIQPIPDDVWMERDVSSKVNSVKNNGPDLLDPPGQTSLL